ncbi:sigma-70 family RNA polymerase sigma factor [Porticoccaceae bacterium LTM1]|nr:sigma-70 family RNA polymerase sigma factor [Porticoccaceae bacterium LTM1]
MKKHGPNVVDFHNRNTSARDRILKRLFDDHAGSLRAFVRRRTRSRVDTEDVVQEVFSRLANMDGLEERIQGSGRNYLFTMANNYIVDLERKETLQRGYDEEQSHRSDGLVNEAGPERVVIAEREMASLKLAIQKLKPSWRRAFVLNRFHFMSYKQVSEKMGITSKQAENYILRALAQLRDVQKSEIKSMEGNSND